MFGFFKSKGKDKAVSKDKHIDNTKERKKDKTNKEEKDAKVVLRKGKEEKSTKSLFRKSKSIEKNKEGNSDSLSGGRKSQSLDGRESGEWGESDQEQLSRQDSSGTNTEEDLTTSGIHTCDQDVARSSSPQNYVQHEGAKAESSSTLPGFSIVAKNRDGPLKFGSKNNYPAKGIGSSGAISAALIPTFTTFTGAVGYPQSQRNGLPEPQDKGTKSTESLSQIGRTSGNATTLMMKPPLNPRLVVPRGPLANFGATYSQPLETPVCDIDEGRLTPSPGLVTPPSSPGLPLSQIASPHHAGTNPPSRPTSPDGRTSMLSTPSSSTSSLSSVSARPISPSGRRTPPGPRMGTGGRITSSPTAGRKAVRTNIKTNPTVTSRRAGSRSPVNPSSSPTLSNSSISFIEGENLQTPPSSPVSVRHVSSVQTCPGSPGEPGYAARHTPDVSPRSSAISPSAISEFPDIQPPQTIKTKIPPSFPATKSRLSSSPSPPPKVSFSSDTKPEASATTSHRSSSPTVGKSRHSISSMHSLESIPENESDGHTSASDTLERNSHSRGTLSPSGQQPNPVVIVGDSTNLKSGILAHAFHPSTPEALVEKPCNPGVARKLSYSLTPVNEEKLPTTTSRITETRNNTPINKNICPAPGTKSPSTKPVANVEKPKSSPVSNKNFKERDEAQKARKRDPIVKYEKETQNENIKKKVYEGRANTLPSRTPTTPDVKKIGAIGALSHLTLRKPNVDTITQVVEPGPPKTEILRAVEPKPASPEAKTIKQGESRNINKKLEGTSRSVDDAEAATHVIFRIPLSRNSMTDSEDKERRVSVEILPEVGGGINRKEKENTKDRPRSVSTSRELRREKSDIIIRRRVGSDAGEGREEKEGGKVRTRVRSSSTTRRHRMQRNQTSEDKINSPGSDKTTDNSEEDVIVPWRKRTRSKSRVSVNPTNDSTLSSTNSSPDKISAASSIATKETVDQQENVKTKQNIDVVVKENEKQVDSVTAPPRHRSKSQDTERRRTRSVTLSEIQRATTGVDLEVKEPQGQRRARSSSRTSETSHNMDTDGDVTKTRRPPRRRSSSTTRRSTAGVIKAKEDKDTKMQEQAESTNEAAPVNVTMEISKTEENNCNAHNIEQSTNGVDSKVMKDNEEKKREMDTQYGSAVGKIDTIKESDNKSVEANHTEEQTNKEKTPQGNSSKDIQIVVKRSVELQTDSVQSSSIMCQTEGEDETTRLLREERESARKELAAQEERYQKQVDQLTLSLAQSQEEVSKLTKSLESLKGAHDTLKECEELQEKLSLLQQDVRDRNAQLDCVRSELQYSKNESELTKAKLKKLEEDLDSARQKNLALQNQITATANCDKTEELEGKIKEMEEKLKTTVEERDKLTKTIEEIEAERDEEIKIIQDALDEAAQEREDLISTFEKEFQNMTTMNSAREQQLMEDFEWKLREMEKDHKKKLEERDRKAEERITAMRNMVESELADSLIQVAEDRRVADEKLAEVGHLKSYEAEAIQLRGVTHELQKALRASAREMERLSMHERLLEEEIRGLKKTQPGRQNTLHRVKRQAEEAEAEFRQKQEKMKNELNAQWEDKLRSECSRLKGELDELHAEEKHLAVESIKVQKEQDIRTLKQTMEQRLEERTKEIAKLKDSLTDKDAYYHKEMENLRTTADRDVWELRRKLQRLDEKNWSQQELLQEKHQEELERIRSDYKDRVDGLEARLAKATQDCDEESRAKAEKQHNEEMDHICQQHRLSMERLREELESEKFQAVEEARVIVSQHLEYVNNSLREQLTEAVTSSTQYRDELEAVRAALTLREEVIGSLEEQVGKLKGNTEATGASSYKDSQSSIASSDDSGSTRSSSNSQDRLSLSESVGASIESQDDAHKSGGSGLLGKMFGGGWFSGSKSKEGNRRGSAPNKQSS
ncbi:hypothetical protein Pmani_035010 [Petrolisthes manimaculis]|uniref:Uncharacterized protein n=1 Tax=Petrolisthes manimaculis TaxID=1843537 RepID=A0AAE1NLG8_9EUCA|nr:hypothetical protein Pmani_035010 [Petrolisthes manimaculis]